MNLDVTIILVGRGKLATATSNYLNKIGQKHVAWADLEGDWSPNPEERYVILYASNKGRMEKVLDFHNEHSIPMINGCTDFALDYFKERNNKGLILHAPNWDLQIVTMMAIIKKYGKLLTMGAEYAYVGETHQESKTSIPGTAKVFASALGLPIDQIDTERKPIRQISQWGVPEEHLDGHAYHNIMIAYKGGNKQIGFYTKVHGREEYPKGVMSILRALLQTGIITDTTVLSIEYLIENEEFLSYI